MKNSILVIILIIFTTIAHTKNENSGITYDLTTDSYSTNSLESAENQTKSHIPSRVGEEELREENRRLTPSRRKVAVPEEIKNIKIATNPYADYTPPTEEEILQAYLSLNKKEFEAWIQYHKQMAKNFELGEKMTNSLDFLTTPEFHSKGPEFKTFVGDIVGDRKIPKGMNYIPNDPEEFERVLLETKRENIRKISLTILPFLIIIIVCFILIFCRKKNWHEVSNKESQNNDTSPDHQD